MNALRFLQTVQRAKDYPDCYYVEGFALSKIGAWLPHAWIAAASLNVIDLTWDEPESHQYFGVKFTDRQHARVFLSKGDGIDSLFSMGVPANIEAVLMTSADTA